MWVGLSRANTTLIIKRDSLSPHSSEPFSSSAGLCSVPTNTGLYCSCAGFTHSVQAQAAWGKRGASGPPAGQGTLSPPFLLQGLKAAGVLQSPGQPRPSTRRCHRVGVTLERAEPPRASPCSDTSRTSLRVSPCPTRLQRPLWFDKRQSQAFPEKWGHFHPQEVLAEQRGAASHTQNSLGNKEWPPGATPVRLCCSCTPQLAGGCALSIGVGSASGVV